MVIMMSSNVALNEDKTVVIHSVVLGTRLQCNLLLLQFRMQPSFFYSDTCPSSPFANYVIVVRYAQMLAPYVCVSFIMSHRASSVVLSKIISMLNPNRQNILNTCEGVLFYMYTTKAKK